MFRLVKYLIIIVMGLRGALRPKILNNNKKYFTDGNFFIVLTTIFVAVEPVVGIASIGLCSNRSTEP